MVIRADLAWPRSRGTGVTTQIESAKVWTVHGATDGNVMDIQSKSEYAQQEKLRLAVVNVGR